MAYTEADLIRVRAEMAAARTVEFADRSVTRRSMDELRQLEQAILTEISSTSTARRPKRAYGVMTSRGF